MSGNASVIQSRAPQTDAAIAGKLPAALPDLDTAHIGVIGLGYVGLPLAVAFGRRFATSGFDINPRRVMELAPHLAPVRGVLRVAPRFRIARQLEAVEDGERRLRPLFDRQPRD